MEWMILNFLIEVGNFIYIELINFAFRSVREYARRGFLKFVEVYFRCLLEEFMRRDTGDLCRKALARETTNMTGIQNPYEEPITPEVTIDTEHNVSSCYQEINITRAIYQTYWY